MFPCFDRPNVPENGKINPKIRLEDSDCIVLKVTEYTGITTTACKEHAMRDVGLVDL